MRGIRTVFVVVVVLWGTAGAQAASDGGDALRFARRIAPYYPGSTFELTRDEVTSTANGRYRFVTIERTCDSSFLSGPIQILVDEETNMAYSGTVARVPEDRPHGSLEELRAYLEDFLPDALSRSLSLRVEVDWGGSMVRPGGVVPFALRVASGYGRYSKPVAVTADGAHFILAAPIPFDADPVAWRRRELASSDVVVWDHAGSEAPVEIVELSDFECPACRGKWSIIKGILEAHPDQVRHGFVSFPLTRIHPWSFRAASAAWCVAQQDAPRLIDMKEEFYSLQRDMSTSLVEDAAVDFVAARGMDEAAFNDCYLEDDSIRVVLRQIELAHRMGVSSTPTYCVNGYLVQVPQREWLEQLVEQLIRGEAPGL